MKEVIVSSRAVGGTYPKVPFLVRGKFSKALFVCTNVVLKDSQTHFILSTLTVTDQSIILSGTSRLERDYDVVDGPITLENEYA